MPGGAVFGLWAPNPATNYTGNTGQQVKIIGDVNGRTYTSETSRVFYSAWPTIDDLWEGGYCACLGFDYETCKWHLENFKHPFARGHYSYIVKFKRTW
ncbi:MAG: hypothetical protein DRI61_16230 [Chloroflexi bacterium]|nr:MAG: hypothetical protein DRI61_16230 [Chloroflexota bacterium]